LCVQHREGIYWCPTPLRDEDQRSYKVRDVADVQAAPPPPVDEYVSNSTVGSDNEAPAASRRAPSKVAAPRRTRQAAGKMPASQAATQVAEAKKRRGKRTRSAVSADTTTIISDVETIDVEDDEGGVQSPKATMAPSPGRQVAETPHPTSRTQGRSTSSTDPAGDVGSNKSMKKAPPYPCKPDLEGRQCNGVAGQRVLSVRLVVAIMERILPMRARSIIMCMAMARMPYPQAYLHHVSKKDDSVTY
jgi:hypothetical protein